MEIQLICKGQSRIFTLEAYRKDTVTFGRRPDCDIVINVPYVSRMHGYFRRQNGQWYIMDQHSTCGIWYQGQKLTGPAPMNPHAKFMIFHPNAPGDSLTIEVKEIAGQDPISVPVVPVDGRGGGGGYGDWQNDRGGGGGYGDWQNDRGGGGGYQDRQYYDQRAGEPGEFAFDGSGGEYFGMFLVNALLLGITFGIMYPWVVCRNLRWRKSHTIINGRRLVFTGTTGQLWGKWIIWWLLSVVTCGIYSFWVAVRMQEWEMKHTYYEDGGSFRDGQEFEDSFYDGEVGERLGQVLVANLLTGLSCGIAAPWMMVKVMKFDMAHSVIAGDRMHFNGDGAGYWGENFLVNLLTAITCGIYRPWGICRINKWVYRNTSIQSSGNMPRKYH